MLLNTVLQSRMLWAHQEDLEQGGKITWRLELRKSVFFWLTFGLLIIYNMSFSAKSSVSNFGHNFLISAVGTEMKSWAESPQTSGRLTQAEVAQCSWTLWQLNLNFQVWKLFSRITSNKHSCWRWAPDTGAIPMTGCFRKFRPSSLCAMISASVKWQTTEMCLEMVR